MSFRLSHVPLRLTAGSFILNSGLSKWSADAETAQQLHGFAAGTYPAVQKVEPPIFVKALAAGEIALGAALLLPGVSSTKAGAGLVAFSGGLLGLYAKTPGMRDGIRPTQQGTAIAKDVWLLGIGSSLVIDGSGDSHKVRKAERKTARAERKAARLERKNSSDGLVSKKQKKALKKSTKKAKKKAAKTLAKASSH
ncbi:hypothetical protein IFT73_12165 [Aeromicrobium sp. CFBP 8757]|uniref:hypothetical protein n=1 Tax=Aeromicrobium sp. CFBP 8757 TaxID=2775288 RepID=UPI00177B986C|nr:hypothetical protein [Aeromicrobium sp. CFBP 8757]MBD8607612.1 hypothetical protein [Aeromicrobium sp. CFBP 8757]